MITEKVFAALYNWMTYESDAETLSLHRTKEGAENAKEKHKAKDKEEYDKRHLPEYDKEQIALMKQCGYSEARIKEQKEDDRKDWPKKWQWWGVREMEIQE